MMTTTTSSADPRPASSNPWEDPAAPVADIVQFLTGVLGPEIEAAPSRAAELAVTKEAFTKLLSGSKFTRKYKKSLLHCGVTKERHVEAVRRALEEVENWSNTGATDAAAAKYNIRTVYLPTEADLAFELGGQMLTTRRGGDIAHLRKHNKEIELHDVGKMFNELECREGEILCIRNDRGKLHLQVRRRPRAAAVGHRAAVGLSEEQQQSNGVFGAVLDAMRQTAVEGRSMETGSLYLFDSAARVFWSRGGWVTMGMTAAYRKTLQADHYVHQPQPSVGSVMGGWALGQESMAAAQDPRHRVYELVMELLGSSRHAKTFLTAVADEDPHVGVHKDAGDLGLTCVQMSRVADKEGTYAGGNQFALVDLKSYAKTHFLSSDSKYCDDVELVFVGAEAHCMMEGYDLTTNIPSLSAPEARMIVAGVYAKTNVLVDVAKQLDAATSPTGSGRLKEVATRLFEDRAARALSQRAVAVDAATEEMGFQVGSVGGRRLGAAV